jgi:hypothetical protein
VSLIITSISNAPFLLHQVSLDATYNPKRASKSLIAIQQRHLHGKITF